MSSSSALFFVLLSLHVCVDAQLSGTSGRGGVSGGSSVISSSDDYDLSRVTSNVVIMVVAGIMCGLLVIFSVGVVFILTCCKSKTGPIMERARGSMMWARGSLFTPSPNGRSNSFFDNLRGRSRSSSCGDRRYKASDVDREASNQLSNE